MARNQSRREEVGDHAEDAARQASLGIESRAMAARKRTPAEVGALAAALLSDACRTCPDDPLRLRVVRDLALDLERRLAALSHPLGEGSAPDYLVEAALACADLAILAACNLPELPDEGKPLAKAAVHLAAGATRALIVLVESHTETLDETHAENLLGDTRSARWRADLAIRQIEEAPD